MEKTRELETKPIGKLLLQYSLPAVIATLVNAIYNVVDRMFVGTHVGEEALAGLTIVFPIMMIIFAFSNLVGIGGVALVSISLGEKKPREASRVFANMIGLGIIIGLIVISLIYFNIEGLLGFFGSTPEVQPYALSYLQIILFGSVFQMQAFILTNAVRSEGQPMLSMAAMMTSAITNIILDYLFIVVLGMGVQGAALATVCAQILGLLLLLSFYIRGKSGFEVKVRDFIPNLKITKNIFSIGFASFITMIATSVSMLLLNIGLVEYGGNAAVASMAAINSLFTMFIMPIHGIQQGMQPIIGYNHGAHKNKRVYRTLVMAIVCGVCFATMVFALMQVFPVAVTSIFIDPSSDTMKVAVNGLRIFMISLPLLPISLLGVGFYQSIGKGKKAMVFGAMRQIIFLIPLVLTLPKVFKLNGVWMSVPISDGFAIVITAIALISSYKQSKKEEVLNEGIEV